MNGLSPGLWRRAVNLPRALPQDRPVVVGGDVHAKFPMFRRSTMRGSRASLASGLVARRIHELSSRRNGPFVAVNCAALVETLFEAELLGIVGRHASQ
jgi:hypothetical protein